jgi:hypothetical protein
MIAALRVTLSVATAWRHLYYFRAFALIPNRNLLYFVENFYVSKIRHIFVCNELKNEI